ncbi:MAG: NTP transferase domain-containing protein [Clostridiales bacterium]|jgi:dTDP-glucose pyrophosphorylase|nr:NTP transferase domain-containing protein [Clostridiales bacterium]
MDFAKLLISENNSLIDALDALDKSAKKVLFVVEGGKLRASISDGDIRRFLIRSESFSGLVKDVANYSPKYVLKNEISRVLELMRENRVETVPVVDEQHMIVDVVNMYDFALSAPRGNISIPVVINAGGRGTRLYPYTKILPKPLIPVGGIPISERIIKAFAACGCDRFYMIVNHKKGMVRAYFNDQQKDYSLSFIEEDEPLGTGGGLCLLKGAINSTFIFTNCDVMLDEDFSKICDWHKNEQNAITTVCAVKRHSIPYGVVECSDDGQIVAIKEKPEVSHITNTGIYVVNPEVLNLIQDHVKTDFPDVIQMAIKIGLRVGAYKVGEHSWLDMGEFDVMEDMASRFDKKQTLFI